MRNATRCTRPSHSALPRRLVRYSLQENVSEMDGDRLRALHDLMHFGIAESERPHGCPWWGFVLTAIRGKQKRAPGRPLPLPAGPYDPQCDLAHTRTPLHLRPCQLQGL
jgi:hypothetical protein